jgi:hypothetical protein
LADTIAITAGSGTTINTDDVGGVHTQRVKATWGPDGTINDTDVASGKAMPVQLRVSDGTAFAFNSGAASAGTLRTVSASDDPIVTAINTGVAAAIPAGNNNIGDVDVASIAAGTNNIGHVGGLEYETVAASQTAQALGATGGTGDYLSGVLVVPATTSPGNVIVLDNAISITVFTGGASSVSNLVPFFIPIGAKSVSGAWKITTGANVSVIGIGDFT